MARTPTPTTRRPARPPQRKPEKNLLNYPRAGARGPLRWWPSLRLLFTLGALGIIAAVGALFVAYQLTDIPEPNAESGYATSTVYYADGTTPMADFNASGINRVVVGSDAISQSVKDAIIASEDKTFYENRGISLTGIGRAAVGVVTGEDRGGGSTITQQYVKNVYLTNEVTYTRKAQEALIALKIDQQYSKDAILTNYLNTIYFGRGAYGIQAAAQVYYGKNASELTDPEAALLVGIVPAPSAWDPLNDPEQAQSRYAYVVNSMVDTGALTRDEALAIPQMPGTLEISTNEAYRGPRGHILAAVREELVARDIMTEDEIDTGGFEIVTTIDPTRQQFAEDVMADQDVYPAEDLPATVQGGLISIDPNTGGVVAMYGGADYLTRQTNSVLDARAQAGSTFKPFTLVAALEQGHSLSETFNGNSGIFVDGYVDGSGKRLPVDNFGDDDYGRINLLTATANSVNTAYVALNEEVGPEATAQVAQTAIGTTPGVSPSEIGTNLANVLGTSSVHPVEMAGAFSTFAAQGVKRETHFVSSVTSAAGPRYTADTTGQRVFDEGVMADTTYALEGVVEDGSASWAQRLDRPAAGKTGSTSGNLAAWFSGYTPQLETTVVFFNSSDGSHGETAPGTELSLPRVGGREFTGGAWPTRIWTAYMQRALEGTEELDFPNPTSQGRGSSQSTSTATSTPSESRSETSQSQPSETQEETSEPEQSSAAPTETPAPTEEPSAEAPAPEAQAPDAPAAGAAAAPGAAATGRAAEGGPGADGGNGDGGGGDGNDG